jgi:hypothetical protein
MKHILEMATYKYGSYRGDDVMEFDDEKELVNWILNQQTFNEYYEEMDESPKWEGRFTHDGINYHIAIDC